MSSLGSPTFLRSASAPFARRGHGHGSPFVRLRPSQAIQLGGRLTEYQPKQEDAAAIDHALPPELEDTGSEADTHSCRPSFVSPRSTDYCCAICIELLLRPVVLSCGHRLCRGCWVSLLKGSQARSIAARTGNAACPLGRCEVKASVPEVDRDLESEMRSQLGFRQLATHATAAELAPLDEESAAAAAVNAWAAAGFKLDEPEEIEAAEELEAAESAAAVAAGIDLESWETRQRRSELRTELGNFAFLLVLVTLVGFGLFVLNDGAEVRGVPPHANGHCMPPLVIPSQSPAHNLHGTPARNPA